MEDVVSEPITSEEVRADLAQRAQGGERMASEAPSAMPRPTGGMLLGWGWALVSIGVLLVLFGVLLMPAYSVPGRAGIEGLIPAVLPTPNAARLPVILLGAASVQLGILLALVGQIVRAMFFLPGRTVTTIDLEQQS